MIVLRAMCFHCRHFENRDHEHWFKCSAFPNGIPDEIIMGAVKHIDKYPGDRGIRFEEGTIGNEADKVLSKMNNEILKDWSDWSRFRKPKYEPSNKKSVAACRKFIANGVVKPGCARAVMLADNMYEPGTDDNEYVPFEPVDPKKFFSRLKEEREQEQQKSQSLNKIDMILDSCNFFRDSIGRVIITNWMSLSPEDRQILSNLFDEKGIIKESRHRDFSKRFEDHNTRRQAKGLPVQKLG